MDAIPGAEPTRQDYEDYVNGTVEFSSSISPYDTDYTPAPTAGPTPSTTTSGGVASWVVPVCVGVVVVIAGVVVVLLHPVPPHLVVWRRGLCLCVWVWWS